MAELGFVLALAGVVIVLLVGVSRRVSGPQGIDWRLLLVGSLTLAIAGAMLRYAGVLASAPRVRLFAALGAFVFGVGGAVACARGQERLASRAVGSLPCAAAAAAVPLVAASIGAAILGLVTLRAGAGSMAPLAFAWVLGATLGSLLGGAPNDSFPLVSLATASGTVAFSSVGARNGALLRSVGFRVDALTALAPLLTVLASIAVLVGARSVLSDRDDPPDAAFLRGFAVATAIGTLSSIAATHWWARPPGRGAWLAIAATIAAIASTLVLLIGRYYDDPMHRAGRAIARAQRGGPKTRLRTGARFGVEGALLVLTAAIGAAVAAARVGDHLGLQLGGTLGTAAVLMTALPARGYLDALAMATSAGDARTLAHDLFVVALATLLLLPLFSSVAVVAVVVAAALVGAAISERVAAAHGGDPELRRRAAVLPLIAGAVLSAAGLLDSVLGI